LLVDLNRSLGRPTLFSEFTAGLSEADRDAILRRHYFPFRHRVQSLIEAAIERRQAVLHVSVHSFTPVLDGAVRKADVALLYDPSRRLERSLSQRWRAALMRARPDLRVRRNYPYLGIADGLTTSLRRRFSALAYSGIELETNARWHQREDRVWREFEVSLIDSLVAALS
jgi:predicted N-formylglutamate amidohydrolase